MSHRRLVGETMTSCVRCGRPVVEGVWRIHGAFYGLCPIHTGYAIHNDIVDALHEKASDITEGE